MASVGAFVQMMEDFLGEMSNLFPNEKGIKKFMTQFDLLKSTNPKKCVETYMNGIAPWYNACLQCGHMYGHAVKSSLPGTKLARGS